MSRRPKSWKRRLTDMFRAEREAPATPGAARRTQADYEAWDAWHREYHPEAYRTPLEVAALRSGPRAFEPGYEPTAEELSAADLTLEGWRQIMTREPEGNNDGPHT